MCGIAGLMTYDGAAPPAAPLRAMGAALRHRGPDGDGRYRSGDVGMVQTRLAIIDLATGDQPLYEPGGAALIANGEIYNYLELRADLGCARSAAFSTQSDCELPLHLYRRYGLDFTAHLRGMYAIALHDPAAGRLVLARDPFGIKPLYYAETPRAFAFASEPGALIEAGIVAAAARSVGAQRAGADAVHNRPRDDLRRDQSSAAGRDGGGAPGAHRRAPAPRSAARGRAVAARRGRGACPARCALFAESVRLHQRSDVPFGMFLSGGIDSTAVLVMMARLAERPVKAFTIGFAGERGRRRAPGRARRRRCGRRRACRGRVSTKPISGGCCPRSSRRSTIRPPIMRSCRPGLCSRGA